MNLVTTGNGAISLATCIVGLVLFLPRSNVMALVRYAVLMMRESSTGRPTHRVLDQPVEIVATDVSTEDVSAEAVRELVHS